FIQPAGFIRLRHGRYSQSFATRDENAIKTVYQDSGFQDAKVAINTTGDIKGKKGDVAITIAIDEGPQYKVAALNVDGITRSDRDKVIAQLASVPGQPFSQTNIALDRDYILTVYQSAGYPDATFEARMMPGPGPSELTVYYMVTEGQPRFVRD